MALDYKSSLVRYRRYMQLVQEKPMIKASLYVTFSLVLMIILLVLALRPTLVTIAGLAGEIRTKSELSEQLNDKILKLQDAASLLSQNRDRLKLLDEAVPEVTEWLRLVAALESMASGSGIVVTEMSLGPAQVAGEEIVANTTNAPTGLTETLPEGVSGLNFRVTATGEYEQIKTYLADIENLRRIVLLKEARIYRDTFGQLTLSTTGLAGYAKKAN